jgi:hypothetical protein
VYREFESRRKLNRQFAAGIEAIRNDTSSTSVVGIFDDLVPTKKRKDATPKGKIIAVISQDTSPFSDGLYESIGLVVVGSIELMVVGLMFRFQ